MASGNHVCNPICADFPIAPINNKVQIIGNTGSSVLHNVIVESIKKGANGNTT
jgi:hypothetical protein